MHKSVLRKLLNPISDCNSGSKYMISTCKEWSSRYALQIHQYSASLLVFSVNITHQRRLFATTESFDKLECFFFFFPFPQIADFLIDKKISLERCNIPGTS